MKKAILALSAMLISCAANAQLLWKVTSPDTEKTSYIVGTHHIAPPGMIDSISGLTEAIDKIDMVLGEVDMTDLNPMEVQQSSLSHMMAPADSTLSKLFTTEQLDSINTILTKYTQGMAQVAQLDMMKPIAVSQTIALLQSQLAFPGFDPSQQLDTRIQAIAKAGGKKTGGLETLEFQMRTLFDTPVSQQASDLMEAVRNDSTAIEDCKRLAAAYVAGDIEEINKMLSEGSSALDTEAKERLLIARNHDWAEKLSVILPKEQVLIAVGCGHLPGEEGLIELLRKNGYTVSPVKK